MSTASPIPPADAKAFSSLLEKLRAKRGHALEAAAAAHALASPSVDLNAKTDFLRELSTDLWTSTLLAEFAQVFRSLARNPHVEAWAGRAVDVCGTGGDHSGSFNVSTATAFVLAAARVPVFKHGNRAQTSHSGSADFLEKLGFPLDAAESTWRAALRELNFAFFFAPAYHPAFQHITPARKALAAEHRRTVFNILGPLLNPGRPVHQLVGVFDWELGQLLAASMEQIGVRRGLVVHGQLPAGGPSPGLDELSVMGNNFVTGIGELRFLDPQTLQPQSVSGLPREFPGGERPAVAFAADKAGLAPGELSALAGGDATRNAHILEELLNNRGPVGLRDTVCLNAGAALWVANRAGNLKAGVDEARRLLTSGEVLRWLQRAQSFFHTVKN
jgi:anthranilate phosphoribosyltransferase